MNKILINNKNLAKIIYISGAFIIVISVMILLSTYLRLAGSVEAAGNTYYVSTATGNDTSGNGSAGTPWKTITKAVQMMTGGDKIIIKAGIYNEAINLSPTKDGTALNPTTFEAAAGESVTIKYPTDASQIFFVRADYVTLKDLTFDGAAPTSNATSQCVLATPGASGTSDLVGFVADNLTIKNCEGHGIEISGQYNGTQYYGTGIIKNSRISNSSLMNENDPGLGSGWGSGVKVRRGGKDIVIENNEIFGNWGEGVGITRATNVIFRNNTIYNNFNVNIYVDNSINVDVYQNFSYCVNSGTPGFVGNNGSKAAGISIGEEYYGDAPLWGNQLSDVSIFNNVVYNCARGLTWYGTDSGIGGLAGALIAHNTFYQTDNTGSAIYFSRESEDNVSFKNNIIRSNSAHIFLDFTGGTYNFDNNYWVGGPPSETIARGPNDINNTEANLAFTSLPGFNADNFKIGATSFAINKGQNLTANGITTDYMGTVRDVTPDIGAFELFVPAVSISLSTDGVISFGSTSLSSTIDTTPTGLNDIQTVAVTQGPADLLIKSTNFSDGTNTWSLNNAIGMNQMKLEFSANGTTWNTFTTSGVNFGLATNVAQSQNQNLYLKMSLPSGSSTFNNYSGTITVTAVSP